MDKIKPTEHAHFLGVGITILALVVLAVFVDIESMKAWIESAGIWGPLIFIILKISTIVLAPLSGAPLYPLVGLLFGFWPGILYIIIGDFLGYTISFFISRIFGRSVALRFISGNEHGLLAKVVDNISDTKGFFLACLTLFAVPEVLSYGAGLGRLHYVKFISILMPFSLVAASILVFFGSILDPASESFLIGLGIPALGALAVLIGGYLFIQRMNKSA